MSRRSQWWKAFTKLKRDRLWNFRQATLGSVIYSLGAANLFFPKYWNAKGRPFPGSFHLGLAYAYRLAGLKCSPINLLRLLCRLTP
jgi:hypothetical protein